LCSFLDVGVEDHRKEKCHHHAVGLCISDELEWPTL
jgi:hypothetical protein